MLDSAEQVVDSFSVSSFGMKDRDFTVANDDREITLVTNTQTQVGVDKGCERRPISSMIR